jgi:hypothetical protein
VVSVDPSDYQGRTYRRYEELWRIHLEPTLGDVPVQQLHRGRIKGFLSTKLTEIKPSRFIRSAQQMEGDLAKEREPLARNTVRNIHAVLRAMLKSAVDDGVLLANPAEKLGRQLRFLTSKATRQEDIKAMSRDQRRVFLEAAARHELVTIPYSLHWPALGCDSGRHLPSNGRRSTS